MALITIYDATENDIQQLSGYLQETDHHWDYVNEPIQLDNLNPETEVISVFVSSIVSREIIEKLPKLRLIACRSTGYNNVDLAAAREHGVTVLNVPTYGEHTVAEYTFMLLLGLTRKLVASVHSTNDVEFDQKKLTGFDIHSKTLGIIGMGKIGRCVATIARGFGMRVIASDPYPNEDQAKEIGFEYVSLEELAASSDIVTLHAPYTPQNHHLINTEFLKRMKPTALLLNTARGELVDTRAVITALQDHELAGAGLDVLEGEQLMRVNEESLLLRRNTISTDLLTQGLEVNVLKKMPNVLLTPHNAFNSYEAIDRINQTTAQNMIQFWYGNVENQVVATPPAQGKLIIARHGESEWNAEGKWTGTRDVHLSEKGFHEAALLGQAVKDITFDYAFISQQIRAFETYEGMVDAAQQFDIPYQRSDALNERDYGDYTGLNKWEVQKQLGETVYHGMRREWNYPIPHGETLKMVYERAVPYYLQTILPVLQQGKTVLVVSHGNAIRALMKYIENVSDADIANLEMPFGNVFIYDINSEGHATHREERRIATTPPPA